MKISLNGEEKEINGNSTIKDILEIINAKSPMLVVERNLEIVQKDQYETCYLQDGDKLEVVSFFGGG
ncbi:MAG: thiamine biosynthesis protein ThiS [Candidatus Melainabacteria bacterium RIFOXYA12_FULL_32_12]|nr:MAG: thiamine biosynthesis protein ThiS [Candidatus Melainabacteria bacterium RIFOXYA2_FULL_32_9]OGI25288.1 MAG: thiamine biosynthesis protein ThiS [Candidatus Melainabacteria bacterium RIFOXYA12_FULL_32_12]